MAQSTTKLNMQNTINLEQRARQFATTILTAVLITGSSEAQDSLSQRKVATKAHATGITDK